MQNMDKIRYICIEKGNVIVLTIERPFRICIIKLQKSQKGEIKMKKLVSMLLCLVMVFSAMNFVNAAEEISVTINGVKQNYDVMPQIVDGRTLVPMRGIFEALGAEVGWIDHSKTVTGTRNNKTVKMRIDDNMAYIDGAETILDVPATIINGRTMVPVRFISEMLGEKVDWDGATKTVMIESDYLTKVAIQPGLKPLTNNIHRDIPKDFKTSSSYDDIIYYEKPDIAYLTKTELVGSIGNQDVKKIIGMDELFNSKVNNEGFSTLEKAEADGEVVAKFTITNKPEATSKCIYKFAPISGYTDGNMLLLQFDARVTSGGEKDGTAKIQFQLEEEKSGKHLKNIWETVSISNEWKTYHIFATAMDTYDNFGIRPGGVLQTVEIKNFSLSDVGNSFTLEDTGFIYSIEESNKDAQWRKDALKRIDEVRKGDFKVVVKDKDGNVIPDAKVNFDMFESEYNFGTAVSSLITRNETYRKNLGKYFNTMVHETVVKWAPYLASPKAARTHLNLAKEAGVKRFRGHSIIWEKLIGSDGKTPMTPTYLLDADGTVIDDKDYLMNEIKNWTYHITDEFAGEICEWDVVNEIEDKTSFRSVHGDEMMIDWFKWAVEGSTDAKMYYNQHGHNYNEGYAPHREGYEKYIRWFKENNASVDAVGIQSHMEFYNGSKDFKSIDFHYNTMKTLADLGYDFAVTEYSFDTPYQRIQAEFTRDYFILAMSMPECNGFTLWGFWQGSSYAKNNPVFDKEWNLKPAGEQILDLMYNKFWTHDAKATTKANGEASIRGFYGDYDVTVTVGDKTKTLSCSYHKGYDNVLEFVMD